ncbi:hypothetical protein SPAN111604_05955 [Sphingomonas antarctica]|uniref:hypothetical protein n=1 Tax=Sphingomonas antarctica TaxID=2040274 RepID=UPI0039E7B3AD
MKHAIILSLGLAFAATAAPATAHDAICTAIERHEPKSWFTPEQKAFIQAKCGVDVDDHQRSLNIQNNVMICPDGRTVDDPYVKVMSDDVSRRANDFARNVMKQADVQRAIALTTNDSVHKAIAEANVDARVAEALAQADIARTTAARVRDALTKSGLGDTH